MKTLARLAAILLAGVVLPAAAAALDTVTASRENLPEERWFDGTVQALRQSTVSAETSGRVQEILFDVGDRVTAGSVILRLVSNEQQQNYNQARAARDEAQSGFEIASRDFQRAQELSGKQLIAKADVDRASAAFAAAKARLSSADAALKAAGERLSYTEVRAPYSGVVSERLVEIGEAVHPGTPLMSGFDPLAYRVEADLPQALAQEVDAQHRARIVTDRGAVIAPDKFLLFPQVDAATGTVRLRLDLPRAPSELRPGQFVKVAVVTGEVARVLVPEASVVHRSEITALYVVTPSPSGEHLQLRQVRLGNTFGDRVEVLSGLEAGEPVARDPVAAGIAAAKQGTP